MQPDLLPDGGLVLSDGLCDRRFCGTIPYPCLDDLPFLQGQGFVFVI